MSIRIVQKVCLNEPRDGVYNCVLIFICIWLRILVYLYNLEKNKNFFLFVTNRSVSLRLPNEVCTPRVHAYISYVK